MARSAAAAAAPRAKPARAAAARPKTARAAAPARPKARRAAPARRATAARHSARAHAPQRAPARRRASGAVAAPVVALPGPRLQRALRPRRPPARHAACSTRCSSGRGWIALVFVLLAGIVFFNVDLLQMNRDIARNADEDLRRSSARSRATGSTWRGSRRPSGSMESAAQLGLVQPVAGRGPLPEGAPGLRRPPGRQADHRAEHSPTSPPSRSTPRLSRWTRPSSIPGTDPTPTAATDHRPDGAPTRPSPTRPPRRRPPRRRPPRRASPCRPRSAARQPAPAGAGRASRRRGSSSGASACCSPSFLLLLARRRAARHLARHGQVGRALRPRRQPADRGHRGPGAARHDLRPQRRGARGLRGLGHRLRASVPDRGPGQGGRAAGAADRPQRGRPAPRRCRTATPPSSTSAARWTPRSASRSRSSGIEGIGTVTEPKRVYPQGYLASQVLGFVGTDNVGLSGLEYSQDDALARRGRRAPARQGRARRAGQPGRDEALPAGREPRSSRSTRASRSAPRRCSPRSARPTRRRAPRPS